MLLIEQIPRHLINLEKTLIYHALVIWQKKEDENVKEKPTLHTHDFPNAGQIALIDKSVVISEPREAKGHLEVTQDKEWLSVLKGQIHKRHRYRRYTFDH